MTINCFGARLAFRAGEGRDTTLDLGFYKQYLTLG